MDIIHKIKNAKIQSLDGINGVKFNLDSLFEAIQEFNDEGAHFCTPDGNRPDKNSMISHAVDNMRVNEGYVVADISIFDTIPGKNINSLMSIFDSPYMSMSCKGNIKNRKFLHDIDIMGVSISAPEQE